MQRAMVDFQGTKSRVAGPKGHLTTANTKAFVPFRHTRCCAMIEGMSNQRSGLSLEQEEPGQGRGPFRAPSEDPPAEQAEASGWIADENIDWPSEGTVAGVAERRYQLYEAMRRLEAAVARPSGLADWRMEIETAVADLDSSLDDHIRRTEFDDGLFAEILGGSPHLASRIADLEEEHGELQAACRKALSMAADWSPTRLRRKANVLLARLAFHRQSGAELLYDAYNVDIAAGD